VRARCKINGHVVILDGTVDEIRGFFAPPLVYSGINIRQLMKNTEAAMERVSGMAPPLCRFYMPNSARGTCHRKERSWWCGHTPLTQRDCCPDYEPREEHGA
jgi:hypothetical protein